MSYGIERIPRVPDAIREAVDNDTLAVFIGAGVSRIVGCDGWDMLARNLIKRCHDEGIINYKEKDTLSQTSDHKKTITICYHLFHNIHLGDIFYSEMKKALKEEGSVDARNKVVVPNIYDDICKLRGLFITTNADTHFDRLFNSENSLYRISDFKDDRINKNNLYHIHGSINDKDTLVFTVSEYMLRYTNQGFKNFLTKIFLDYTVLFVGYGVAEFEVLEFILQGKLVDKTSAPKHFMLNPFYKGEENILRYEQSYYNDLGINVLGYEKDDKGYNQLIDVIHSWNNEINKVTGYFHNAARSIDLAVDTPNEGKISDTLQTIRNDESLQDYFFKKLANSSNSLEWLVPLQFADYFAPQNNPKLQKVPNKDGYFTIPHWNILDALVNMAVKNEISPNEAVSQMLLKIVNGIISYRDENDERIVNYRTDWKILETISHFPIQYIDDGHILFIKEALQPGAKVSLIDREIGSLLLPKLIKEKSKNLIINLLDVILHFNKSDKEYSDKYIPVLEKYYLKKTLDHNKKGISEICPIESAKIALSKIHVIVKEDGSQFNYIWIPAIEDHEQNTFPDRYEYQLVAFVRTMLEASDSSQIEPLAKEMLNEEHDIFKRLAYHVINHHYDALSHLFWTLTCNPINGSATHEVFELLKAHCKTFDTVQIETVLNWIETQDIYFSDNIAGDEEKEALVKAYRKKEWLLAILESGDEKVRRRYDEYNAINDAIIDHPGFHSWSYGVRSVVEESPIEEDVFKEMTNDNIADYINSYKEVSSTFRTDSIRINLASSVRKFVSNDPERYSHNLTPFLSLPRRYQYEFLRGFEEAWRNNKDFDWDELLPFILNIIGDSDFWNKERIEDKDDYTRSTIDAICDLLQVGTRDDKHAFNSVLLPEAENIILILLSNTKSVINVTDNLVSAVLNSSTGKVLASAINYSLRSARVNSRDTEERWVEPIKADFSKRLDKTIEPGLEFSVVTAEYLSNLSYLDKTWVSENINRVFDLNSEKHWEAAFIGYIVMQSTLFEEIYCLLRDNGHYEKGLSYPFSEKHVSEKLVQNIVVGYMAGWDDFSDSSSLLSKLFETDNTAYISELVRFIGTYRHKENEEYSIKIKPLWKVIIEKVTHNLTDNTYRIIASNLGIWLSFVDSIDDDIFEWLKISAVSIEENWNASSFIQYLGKHVTKTPSKVGGLYLTMLNAGTYPNFKEEDIVAIVQSLYDLNEKETANKICNMYFTKGYEFLRKTFENHSKALQAYNRTPQTEALPFIQ